MDFLRLDSMLMEILQERKTIAGFLDAIFGFLSRNTDFYYEQKNKDDKIGFPPGMKEKIVLKVLQKFDPKYRFVSENSDVPPAVAEVEVATVSTPTTTQSTESARREDEPMDEGEATKATQKDIFLPNEYHNGAKFETYCWSQTPTEIELHIKLPPEIKSGKHLVTDIKPSHVKIQSKLDPKAAPIFDGELHAKCKHLDALWTISESKLQIVLDKKEEAWWDRLIDTEPNIDVSKIDSTRDLNDLPPDSQAAIEKLRWEQQMKQTNQPTEVEKQNLKLLKDAWDAEGSPFKGQPFDPSLVKFN